MLLLQLWYTLAEQVTNLPPVEIRAKVEPVPPAVACVKKGATHAVGGMLAAAAADCIFFGCLNTIAALVIGATTGSIEGCVDGMIES